MKSPDAGRQNRRRLLLTVSLGLWCGLSQGQPATSTVRPENLLPARAVFYSTCDGATAHQKAYQHTAAYAAIDQTGLRDAFDKVVQAVVARLGDEGPKYLAIGQRAVDAGISVAVSLSDGNPPLPVVTVVLHEGAELRPAVFEALGKALPNIKFSSQAQQSRRVTSGTLPNGPPIEIALWEEGKHLVLVAGLAAEDAGLAVAAGKSPNITAHPLWKRTHAGAPTFERTTLGWLDLAPVFETYGDVPWPVEGELPQALSLNVVAGALGLDTLRSVVWQGGYKDEAIWTEVEVIAPGERKGLLALLGQPTFRLADLPPLPATALGFTAAAVDWSALGRRLTEVGKKVQQLAPASEQEKFAEAWSKAQQQIGFNLQTDLLDTLGPLSCVYADGYQGLLGLNACWALEVKDANTLRKTLASIVGRIEEGMLPGARVLRKTKQGQQITTIETPFFLTPAFVLTDRWLLVSTGPQNVELFLLRLNKKLPAWKPGDDLKAALGQAPEQFTSLTITDPRRTVREIVGLAPMLLSFVKLGLKSQAGNGGPTFEMPIDVTDLPPADLVVAPLFPNVSWSVTTEEGVRAVSRQSLPAIPVVGDMSLGTTAVLMGLLLPAVQKAREAARSTQSVNNLKQIGLAMHIFLDVDRSFPSANHENAAIKPDECLSWQADLLPYLDQAPIWQKIDFKQSWNSDRNQAPLGTVVPSFIHPSRENKFDGQGYGLTHYVGMAGKGEKAASLPIKNKNAGIFGYNRRVGMQNITDGSSNTIMAIEASDQFGPWGAAGPSTVRAFTKQPYLNGPDGIGGVGNGTCAAVLADGSVRKLSNAIDPKVLEALSTIAGGETGELP